MSLPLNFPQLRLSVPTHSKGAARIVYIERLGEYDAQGRCQFSLDWAADTRLQGQVFFSNPSTYVQPL